MTYTRLSLQERTIIAHELAQGSTYHAIAAMLSRSVSTVQREVMRNFSAGCYRPAPAHQKARGRACSCHRRPFRIPSCGALQAIVHAKLTKRWSPSQVSRYLKANFPPAMHVSPETIYDYIYLQTRGELKKELIAYLRQKKKNRNPRPAKAEKRGKITDITPIRDRPAEVADRAVPGHWEGDLIIGKDHKSALLTIVERSTRYVLIKRLTRYDALTVAEQVAKTLKTLPVSLTKTLTWDQGKEMARHKQFTIKTGIQVYFCDPASPWQRGTNENTNMLIRDFFPKGTDFLSVSPQKVYHVQHALNERPRLTLGDLTPKQALNQLILNT
jgi:IS30 family transposase